MIEVASGCSFHWTWERSVPCKPKSQRVCIAYNNIVRTVMLYLLFDELAGEGRAGGGIAPAPAPFGFDNARFDSEGCNEDGVVEAP